LAITGFMDLKGRVALVTGGGRGLGRAIALGLAQCGANVVVGSRSAADSERTASLVRELGGSALACPVDVANRPACESFVSAAIREFGSVDVMVCNAGICVPVSSFATDDSTLQQTFAIDVMGIFYSAVAAAKHMEQQSDGGAIIMMSSTAAVRSFEGLACYGAAKAAVNQLVQSLAVEWGPKKIRVNAIAPGWTTNTMKGNESLVDEKTTKQAVQRTPLGRFAEPNEIVGPVLFLASSVSSYITGITLTVDGGYLST
jgi:NAD(P)-dependent dehydrogenase (short-subunit alcohol dehydrogenase family)